ncbi:hypothetical protein [Flagellimonas aquimarina]|uniref:hypothetical protein n=1 Tax=Flagellimonas aquimarina TaxID=2201895 RepID=UPI001404173C|nr:hypothetical protein [Allomuricauda koreensis]
MFQRIEKKAEENGSENIISGTGNLNGLKLSPRLFISATTEISATFCPITNYSHAYAD